MNFSNLRSFLSLGVTMKHCFLGTLFFLEILCYVAESRQPAKDTLKLSSEMTEFLYGDTEPTGKSDNLRGNRWAVLVAGSRGYENYRHQADVCHAYQILKKGGLKDENSIVFMYDDIAFNTYNPRPGVIINNPHGDDVYKGVPKDYTGHDANVHKFITVILANRTALTGGSRKVLDSGQGDHIFPYYSDHGSPGVLGMPSEEYVYAKDLIDVLKKKYDANAYESMVFYVEACESGSMFEGLLPEGLSIYATTAANAVEDSYGTYCLEEYSYTLLEYDTCLGDLYSVSWMEDSDKHDLHSEILEQQYEVVRRRTAVENSDQGSHVMQHGDLRLTKDSLYSYLGTNPANDNYTLTIHDSTPSMLKAVSQCDADLLHFQQKFHRAPEGSQQKLEAQKLLVDEMSHRTLIDQSMMYIEKFLSGYENGLFMMQTLQSPGQPLVDDWNCLKTLVRTYEEQCGSLLRYGMKYTRYCAHVQCWD